MEYHVPGVFGRSSLVDSPVPTILFGQGARRETRFLLALFGRIHWCLCVYVKRLVSFFFFFLPLSGISFAKRIVRTVNSCSI